MGCGGDRGEIGVFVWLCSNSEAQMFWSPTWIRQIQALLGAGARLPLDSFLCLREATRELISLPSEASSATPEKIRNQSALVTRREGEVPDLRAGCSLLTGVVSTAQLW